VNEFMAGGNGGHESQEPCRALNFERSVVQTPTDQLRQTLVGDLGSPRASAALIEQLSRTARHAYRVPRGPEMQEPLQVTPGYSTVVARGERTGGTPALPVSF